MEQQNELYPLSKVMNKILKIYGLESSPDIMMRFRKAIKRFCEKEGIWNTHLVPVGERHDHYFSEEELREIISSDEIKTYIIKNLLDPKQKELIDEADRLAILQKEFWAGLNLEDNTIEPGYDYTIKWEEVHAKKLEIMIEALFLRYFTPVDTERLIEDMEEVRSAAYGDIEPETVEAMRRLEKGSSYYTEKQPPTKPNNK